MVMHYFCMSQKRVSGATGMCLRHRKQVIKKMITIHKYLRI